MPRERDEYRLGSGEGSISGRMGNPLRLSLKKHRTSPSKRSTLQEHVVGKPQTFVGNGSTGAL